MANAIVTQFVFIILVQCNIKNACYCNEIKDGISDGIHGTIQLLNGINELMSAGKDPLSLTTAFADAMSNIPNTSDLVPNLQQLYEKFFLPSNSNESEPHYENLNSTMTPSMGSDVIEQNIKYPQYVTNPITYDTSANLTNDVEMLPPTTEATHTAEVGTVSTGLPELITSETIEDQIFIASENSTFEKILYIQDNVCHKIKYGIESIVHSDLVVMFMKLLELEYLVSKEAWERIKATANEVWDTTLNNDQPSTTHKENDKLNNVLGYLDQTKNQLRSSFNALKRPFSIMTKGIVGIVPNTTKEQDVQRDFCEKFNNAERQMVKTVFDLEKKFNNKLDLEIKKEKEFLEEGKKNPDTMVLFSKETIITDINYVKEKIYLIYDYIKTVAIDQLKKLQVK